MTDETTELLARQRALQAEAEQVRARLDLDRVLGAVGNPVLVGSTALGLMVRRDIDTTVVCRSLDKRPVLAAATELAAHQDVKAMQYRDDSGRFNQDPDKYPDGLYIGLRYHPAQMPEWTLDLWFVDDPARQPDLTHLRTLPERLTDDARLAILRIKALWSALPQYGTSVRSWDIYTAVLDHNVRDTDEFDRWRMQSLTGPLALSRPMHGGHRLPGRVAWALYRSISWPVVRGTTATVSPPMTSRKLLSSDRTVTILPAWVMPTWMRWRATWMPPRLETRRCTTAAAWGNGAGPARRTPWRRWRWPGGMGQGKVRHRTGRRSAVTTNPRLNSDA
jgi:hypothetical protein